MDRGRRYRRNGGREGGTRSTDTCYWKDETRKATCCRPNSGSADMGIDQSESTGSIRPTKNTGLSSTLRKRVTRHVALPSVAPAALFGLYFTPKAVFGCANRGYMALGIVLLATVGSVVTTWKGVSARRRRDGEAANWWLVTTLILLSPVALLFGPLR